MREGGEGGFLMRTYNRLTGPERDTLETAGFTITHEGETATIAGPMRLDVMFPPKKNGTAWLTITLPNGARVDCQTALRELVGACAWVENTKEGYGDPA
jgi:hypothetical protein